jgi:hypothetical protein
MNIRWQMQFDIDGALMGLFDVLQAVNPPPSHLAFGRAFSAT